MRKDKKGKKFHLPEPALYLTAKINEQRPGRTATQTCIPARRPELIGLFTLMLGGGGELEEERAEGTGACRIGVLVGGGKRARGVFIACNVSRRQP